MLVWNICITYVFINNGVYIVYVKGVNKSLNNYTKNKIIIIRRRYFIVINFLIRENLYTVACLEIESSYNFISYHNLRRINFILKIIFLRFRTSVYIFTKL